MIKNFFKVAWRNLLKNKAFSLINISGLAIGMAIALLIGLWVLDELSFDSYHRNHDRIAKVVQQQTLNGNIMTFDAMSYPIGGELRRSYGGDFEYVVMASMPADNFLGLEDKKLSFTGIFMDVEAPKMLTLKMLEGSPDGLSDPHSILLPASTARAFFGDKPALGKILTISNKQQVRVTGVYEDLPDNSTFKGIGFIAPWELYRTSQEWIINSVNKWDNNSFQLYVQLAKNAPFDTVGNQIAGAKQKYVDPEDKKYQTKLVLHPMNDWHLRSRWDSNGIKEGGQITYVWLFTIIGAFVLILACINFMNLSTARSEKRAKEVGIRKTIGSLRSQIVGQFYSESLLVVAFSFLVSVALVEVSLPFFNDVAGKHMHIPYWQPLFWVCGIVFVVVTGIIAGSYPALYLSSFKPIKVLKGTFRTGRLAAAPRQVLVVLQFSVSVVLIIGTIVVYKQLQFTRDRPIGYNRDGVMMMKMKSSDFYGKYDLLKTELLGSGAVANFTESSSPVTEVWATNDGFTWPGKDPNQAVDFATIWVTPEFGHTVDWQIREGRDFREHFATDSNAIVINESAVKFMGLKDPIGTRVKWYEGKSYTIVGVIKDMLMESPFEPVKQTIYFLDYNNVNWIILRLNPGLSASTSVARVEKVFKKIMPAVPFDYKFADNEFASKFSGEERVGRLSTIFASLAIFISCLGLFGLASFVAEQRTKEIGVRKVLGASLFNVWKLLSRDFVLLVGLSVLIASPLAWLAMHHWLQSYTYRTDLSWWIFIVPAAGAIFVTILTVSFQAVRTGLASPVKSLRSE